MKTSTSLFAAVFSSLLVTILANPISERQAAPASCDACPAPGGGVPLWGIFPASSVSQQVLCINYIPFEQGSSVPADVVPVPARPCVADTTTQNSASLGYFPTGEFGAGTGIIDLTVATPEGEGDNWTFEIKVYAQASSSYQLIGYTQMGKTNFTGNPEVVVVPTTLPEIMNFTVPVVSYNWVVEVLYGTQSILVNPWDSAYNPGEVPGHISNSTFNIPVPDAPLPWWYEYTTTTS